MIRVAPLLILVAACSSSSSSSSSPAPSPAPTNATDGGPHDDGPKDPSTALVIGIDAEPFANQGYNVNGLVVKVAIDGAPQATTTKLGSSGPLFPNELRVEAPVAKPDAAVDIEVSGMMDTNELVKRIVKTRFVPKSTKLVHVYLETRCVTLGLLGGSGESGPTCDAGQTCISGKCVAPDVAPSALPDYHQDWTSNPPSACGDGDASSLDSSIVEGSTVTLEQGSQCGHHFYVDVSSMKDLAQFKTFTSISAVVPGSTLTVPTTTVPYALSASGNGTCEVTHVRFQVDGPGLTVQQLLGQSLDVTVSAKDDRGRSASLLRHVKIADTFSNPSGRVCN